MDWVKGRCNIRCTNRKPGPIFLPFEESNEGRPQRASESEGERGRPTSTERQCTPYRGLHQVTKGRGRPV